MVLCQLHPTRFHIHDGDGYRETCVAISADIPDEQAARVFTAFRIWLGRLHEDREAMQEARGLYRRPQGATVFTSEEIFGSGAAGGYLVRRPNLPADGWAVLRPRRPAKLGIDPSAIAGAGRSPPLPGKTVPRIQISLRPPGAETGRGPRTTIHRPRVDLI
ncbi:hypothetical protein [Microbacterium resistens]